MVAELLWPHYVVQIQEMVINVLLVESTTESKTRPFKGEIG